ncbi:Hypothetical protein D9617_32g091700 [Elsinoe fawcettii]|nr:Hypothetical protein D9617_32g091700 [Elsinoe fawcettii]
MPPVHADCVSSPGQKDQVSGVARENLELGLDRKDSHTTSLVDGSKQARQFGQRRTSVAESRVVQEVDRAGSPELSTDLGIQQHEQKVLSIKHADDALAQETKQESPADDKATSSGNVEAPHPDVVPGERSNLSRRELIGIALLEAPGGRLQQHGVANWIGKHVPGYHENDKQMKQGISNALSIYSRPPKVLFDRTDGDENGKHCFYSIKQGHEGDFQRWDYENKRPIGTKAEAPPSARSHKRKRPQQEDVGDPVTKTGSGSGIGDQQKSHILRLKLRTTASAAGSAKSDTKVAQFWTQDGTRSAAPSKGPFVEVRDQARPKAQPGLEIIDLDELPDVPTPALPAANAASHVPVGETEASVDKDSKDTIASATSGEDVSDRSRSTSPYSGLFRHFPSRQSTLREQALITAMSEAPEPATHKADPYDISDIKVVAAEAPPPEAVSQVSRDVGTQTASVSHDSASNVSSLPHQEEMTDEQYQAKVLENIRVGTKFTAYKLSESLPAKPAPVPQSVINARLTKKQRMRLPGNLHISRLGHNTAIERYKAICEHLGLKGGGDKETEEQSNDYGAADIDFENSQPKVYDSLEAMVEMPESVVPMIYEGQLVYTDGASLKNARGRVGRAKNIYRIGSNVLPR